MHQLGDIFDLLRPGIGVGCGNPHAGMLAHRRRDAHPAGLRQCLQAGGDIDGIAEEIAVLDHHVADMDADAEQQPAIQGQALVFHRDRLLDRERTGERLGDAWELGQDRRQPPLDPLRHRRARVTAVSDHSLSERAVLNARCLPDTGCWKKQGYSLLTAGQKRWDRDSITSKLTSKAQTTIPLPVRNALRLGRGDELAYAIKGERVILTKAAKAPADDPFATFNEWSSEADRKRYAEL
jgi:antitoxin PrlF